MYISSRLSDYNTFYLLYDILVSQCIRDLGENSYTLITALPLCSLRPHNGRCAKENAAKRDSRSDRWSLSGIKPVNLSESSNELLSKKSAKTKSGRKVNMQR
jgi:hypothetical protein